MVDFPDYPNVVSRMLNDCIKDPQRHLAVLVMEQEKGARLDFIQNMEYKFVELMSCRFEQTPQPQVQQHISFRYNAMKVRFE